LRGCARLASPYIDETLKVDARDYAESLAAAAFDPTLARITILDKDVHEIRPDDLVLYMSAIFLRREPHRELQTA
jgi:hypothetical protein